MELTLFWQAAAGYGALARSPWIYLAMVLLVWLQYKRIQRVERASFGMRVTSVLREWLASLAFALLAGIVLTAGLLALGVVIDRYDALWMWGVLGVLALIDMRYACVAYAASVLALAHVAAAAYAGHGGRLWGPLATLPFVHGRSLLFLAGVLHIAEGVLVLFSGHRGASPLFVRSRRGQTVGAYILQKFWPVPLVLLTATGTPLPFPALIGFGGMAVGSLPRAVSRRTGMAVILYGALVTALALLSLWRPWVLAVSAILAFTAHGMLYAAIQRREWEEKSPLFVRPARGVRILAVIAGSPAHAMGLQPGEVLRRIGATPVNSSYDIHFAIDQNPAYVKMEVLDERKEARFVGMPVYHRDPHQLGIIAVPDERAHAYMEVHSVRVMQWLWRWWRVRKPAFRSER